MNSGNTVAEYMGTKGAKAASPPPKSSLPVRSTDSISTQESTNSLGMIPAGITFKFVLSLCETIGYYKSADNVDNLSKITDTFLGKQRSSQSKLHKSSNQVSNNDIPVKVESTPQNHKFTAIEKVEQLQTDMRDVLSRYQNRLEEALGEISNYESDCPQARELMKKCKILLNVLGEVNFVNAQSEINPDTKENELGDIPLTAEDIIKPKTWLSYLMNKEKLNFLTRLLIEHTACNMYGILEHRNQKKFILQIKKFLSTSDLPDKKIGWSIWREVFNRFG